MKKNIKELRSKDEKELLSQAGALRGEIAKMSLETYANKPKNTNLVAMKKKELAVLLTVLSEKKRAPIT